MTDKIKPKKLGRPTNDEDREPLLMVNFKADAETLAALDELLRRSSSSGDMVGRRSAVIRAVLKDAARGNWPKP